MQIKHAARGFMIGVILAGFAVPAWAMKVQVRKLTGKVIEIETAPDETVLELKENYAAIDGTPVEQQMMLFRKKELADGQNLEFYEIQDGDALNMVANK